MIHDDGICLSIKNNAQCKTVVVLFIMEDETITVKAKQQWGPEFIDLGEKEILLLQIANDSSLLRLQWTGNSLLLTELAEGWIKTGEAQSLRFEFQTRETVYSAFCRLKIKKTKVTSIEFTILCRKRNGEA